MAADMKDDEIIIEDGIIAGNLYDKHGSQNIVVKYLMDGFHRCLDGLVQQTNALDIHEVGCGEGHLSIGLAQRGKHVRGSDFSSQVIDVARQNAIDSQVDIDFKTASIYDLKPGDDRAELVVCCEVLEHLEEPTKGLEVLSSLAAPYLLVSVPREPLWSCLNMMRGKYLGQLGNTPGHVQKWSKGSFVKFLSAYVDVVQVLNPTPWTMVLCRVR